MIPYARPDLDERDIQAVVEVLRSNWLTQGPTVPRFEAALATRMTAEPARACRRTLRVASSRIESTCSTNIADPWKSDSTETRVSLRG